MDSIKYLKFNESWVIFEPHTYARAYKHKEDFAKVLKDFDHIIITDIYAAREENIFGIKEEDIIKEMEQNFILTINACKNAFGDAAFRNLKKASEDFTNKISPTIFDAITVATSYAIKKNSVDFEKNDYRKNYIDLLKNEEFRDVSSHRTTDIENIFKRIELASEIIYGIKYEI